MPVRFQLPARMGHTDEELAFIREMGIRQSFKGAGEREVKMENSCRNFTNQLNTLFTP